MEKATKPVLFSNKAERIGMLRSEIFAACNELNTRSKWSFSRFLFATVAGSKPE